MNQESLKDCWIEAQGVRYALRDLSLRRALIECDTWDMSAVEVQLLLGPHRLSATVQDSVIHDSVTLQFRKWPPLSKATLRTFLTTKRVGESLKLQWQESGIEHYVGLNELELWEDGGTTLLCCLDPDDADQNLAVRFENGKPGLQVAKWRHGENEAIEPLSERERYLKLVECREIVTHFRPEKSALHAIKRDLLSRLNTVLHSTSRFASSRL